ncbi:hypothetical protein U1329_10775 [Enterococcus cecorum]|uniref:hypothetical protein n=1 Tax=Enterococcus cecorum TaxID=44008 RepID=UPI002ACA89F3|nr:hypothetical protein [Enterococcus cecorum]MDZ5440962.1 hypothetical protein [Enterococcus cecorum]MDZ5499003.1 hypothetical protein [Enterococcus cecorum]MDZ5501115.1 hypothetical protein [Enterococcus cecorum]MDZ5563620.1 hypothetical protein [Enterococcus cecorum]
MNAFQEKFYHFILDRVQADKVEDVKELLAENFAKQSEGTFDVAYLLTFKDKIVPMLKEADKEEVLKIMEEFGKKFQ